MTQRVFEPKVITLVANVGQSITWGVQEFGKYFSQYDAIIRGNVSIRFQVQNATANVIYLSLNYDTLYETIPFQERKSLAGVAASTTVELTKATVPAIGLLKTDIRSITVTVIGAAAGTVRITLLILDGDELAAESGSSTPFGQDQQVTDGYVTINQYGNQAMGAGSNTTIVTYTVPAGKRFIVDYVTGFLDPSPSFPGLLTWSLYLPVPSIGYYVESIVQNGQSFVAAESVPYIFPAGDIIRVDVFNGDTVVRLGRAYLLGREIF